MQVIDNFLDEEYFQYLYEKITDQRNFGWQFQTQVATHDQREELSLHHYYFVHSLYYDYEVESEHYQDFHPLFRQLKVQFLHRARVLLYVNQGKQWIHDRHIDTPVTSNTALIYMNTNDGFTEFETGERVDSIKNRLLLFDGSVPHSSSTPTDCRERMLISVTYL